jgi:ABC-type lipoprotein export system ATPase subunit/predicted phosphodiesterase
MSKILAIADIHLHDYPQRNSFQFQRLYQGSRIVAQNIIEVGKREGADYIAICGDLIEKSIIRPYVMAEAYNFLHTIMSEFKEGWIIWGNHDIDAKSSDQVMTDSCLALFLPPNLKYMHQQQIELEGKKIGFNNWQPEFNLEWVKGELDMLFTHARICYKEDSDLYQSQYLDESKFKIAFCGDIHRPGQLGKYVSIGIPQRCKMSDGEKSTGVLIDLPTGNWKWVDLNPNDNLMKFQYVTVPEQEGWNETFKTWNIYKPSTDKMIDPTANIKVSGWEKIESLVNDAITKAGLVEVHQQVLSSIPNLDAGEVDFNFTPVRFYCKNWRSIDEVEMFFEEGDKILIVGENGSGKSSLLSAIKYAFCDVRSTSGLSSLKPFIQFGTKDCVTEVEFMYQGNRCKLRRGTKEYGLWINEEPMKYNSKADFEADARRRFPFIEYMEVMIHDQDHNQFIGSLTGERLAEIISKAFKLDRIDTYNDAASILLTQLQKGAAEWESKIGESKKVLGFIDSKLASIVLPSKTKEELDSEKKVMVELQRKNQAWNQFVSVSSRLQAGIESKEHEKTELLERKRAQREPSIIEAEITALRNEISGKQGRLVELGGLKNAIKVKESELSRIISDGKNLRSEFTAIDPTRVSVCPTCRQQITPSPETIEALKTKKEEIGKKLEEKLAEYGVVNAELEGMRNDFGNSDSEISNINSEIGRLNGEITKRMSEIREGNETNGKLERIERELTEWKTQLANLGAPEKVELPTNFMEKMSNLESGLSSWNLWESGMKDKEDCEKKVAAYEKEVEGNREQQEKLKSYIKLTGPTGVIYEEVMKKLVAQFNDNTVSYEVNVREFRKKDHLTLVPQFFNNGNWVSYEACSGGQKTVLDIHFLSKIINRVGILILDEFLKHLDPSNHDLCLDMIQGMSIGCTFISSHMESIAAFNNKTCSLSLNQSGLTQMKFS